MAARKDATEDTLEREIALAARYTPRPRDACPAEEIRTKYLEGALEDTAREGFDQHLAGCESCRLRLEQAVLSPEQVPEPDLERIWGSSISVAVLGPNEASLGTLRQATAALERHGATVAPLDPDGELVWAAMDTSAGSLTGDPVDANRLVRWVRRVQDQIDPEGELGAVITAGRGFLGRFGPFGAPFDAASTQKASVRAGELRLSPEVAERLEPLGVRLVADASSPLVKVALAPRPRRVGAVAS